MLKLPEGRTLEFKRDLSSPDGALRSLVGLLPTPLGGIQMFGVEDGRPDAAILALLADTQGRTTAVIAAHLGLSPRATSTPLAALVGRGLVREIGSGPRDPRRHYLLASP
ncbi:MarR family transcriptional regulator [Nevskia sp.]|uniref:MarR family transcriptional regulator n=1 Tax=Nevskia sp. TaxID=1929292 RepID=UPI0025D40593|nr:MarR family transcriptional regulator [Nevskia sp.]